MRIDLFVPDSSVRKTQKFFLRAVRMGDYKLVWKDYEGFEAEVYFGFGDGRAGLVRILVTCHPGSIVSFEVFGSE